MSRHYLEGDFSLFFRRRKFLNVYRLLLKKQQRWIQNIEEEKILM